MVDPVSWNVIEPSWLVVGSGGETLGRVRDVLGDDAADIFNGLIVSPGLLKPSRYVPSERVTAIYEERIEVDLDASGFERLDERAAEQPGA